MLVDQHAAPRGDHPAAAAAHGRPSTEHGRLDDVCQGPVALRFDLFAQPTPFQFKLDLGVRRVVGVVEINRSERAFRGQQVSEASACMESSCVNRYG